MGEPMTIIRTRKTQNFFALSNDLVNDANLSFDAVGLAAYLLAKPHDWEISLTNLKKRGGIGKDKTYRILNELEKAGYLSRTRRRDSGGRLGRTDYILTDIPHPENPDVGTTSGMSDDGDDYPNPGLPDAAKPDTANPPLTKDREKQTNDSEQTLFPLEAETSSKKRKSTDDWFDQEFWSCWVRKDSKKKAREKFHAAVKRGIDPAVICDGAQAFMALCRVKKTERQYIPLAQTWLHQERWGDEEIRPYLRLKQGKEFDPHTYDWTSSEPLPEDVMGNSENLWRWRCGQWFARQSWYERMWGPKPGDEGCRIPAHIWDEMNGRYGPKAAAE